MKRNDIFYWHDELGENNPATVVKFEFIDDCLIALIIDVLTGD